MYGDNYFLHYLCEDQKKELPQKYCHLLKKRCWNSPFEISFLNPNFFKKDNISATKECFIISFEPQFYFLSIMLFYYLHLYFIKWSVNW